MRRSGRDHPEGKSFRKRRRHDSRTDAPKLRAREKSELPGPIKGGNYERDLRDLLGGIGTPKPAPFKPDPFQLEALAALEFEDVLVTAPTGSGKTDRKSVV